MITVEGIKKSYGTVKVIDDLSFKVNSPERLVLLGPSGCGKTTLLRLIAGLEVPDEGHIYIDGQLVSKPGWVKPPHQRGIGYVFQNPALWPHMTVKKNILFGLKNMKKKYAEERLNEVLKITGLLGLEHRYPDEISGGQAKRVALARTLAPKPRHLLMDEPLSNLNTELKQVIIPLIQDIIKQTGGSLIYVTHDLKEANQISDSMIAFEGNGFIRKEFNSDEGNAYA